MEVRLWHEFARIGEGNTAVHFVNNKGRDPYLPVTATGRRWSKMGYARSTSDCGIRWPCGDRLGQTRYVVRSEGYRVLSILAEQAHAPDGLRPQVMRNVRPVTKRRTSWWLAKPVQRGISLRRLLCGFIEVGTPQIAARHPQFGRPFVSQFATGSSRRSPRWELAAAME